MNTQVLRLFTLTAFASLWAVPVQAAETVITFEPGLMVGLEQKAPAGLIAAVVPSPDGKSRDVFKIEWPAHEAIYIASYIDKGGVLIDAPGKYRITAKISVEQLGPECTALALRFLDKGWETFQVMAKITPGEPGWVDVSWTLDTDNFQASGSSNWGGNKNDLIDFPLRLRGFALNFTNRTTGGGTLLVDQVKAALIPAK